MININRWVAIFFVQFVCCSMFSASAFSFDAYDGENCTVVLGSKTVQMDQTLPDQKRCYFSSAGRRFISIKLNNKWNVYNIPKKKLLLKVWSPNELSFDSTLINSRTVVVGYDDMSLDKHINYIVDVQSGTTLVTLSLSRRSTVYGPYSSQELYVITDGGSNPGPCKVIKVTGKNKYATLLTTPFNGCSLYGGEYNSETLHLAVEKTQEHYKYNLANLVSSPKSSVDKDALAFQRRANCEHLYVGKVFRERGGIFGINQEYEVVGFSTSEKKATIKSPDSSYRQEVDCYKIPE